jgi:hypothetical protein
MGLQLNQVGKARISAGAPSRRTWPLDDFHQAQATEPDLAKHHDVGGCNHIHVEAGVLQADRDIGGIDQLQ